MKRSLIVPIAVVLMLSSCQLARYVWYNYAGVTDYKIFPKRDLHASNNPFLFIPGVTDGAMRPKALVIDGKDVPFEKHLKQNKTLALLIIHKDRMVYEQYFSGYDSSSIVPSFSIAKAVTTALIGCALQDGLIRSVEQPVTDFIPELRKNGFDKVTLKHLLQMTSGIDFNESYSDPLGDAATFYYGTDLRENCRHLTLKREPGKVFDYNSGSTQLLGFVLERALKGETITHYFDRRMWFPLGMEFDGSWSMEKKEGGLEKTFCCLNARARDFAKLGRLYLKKGNWNGKQIIPASWISESTTPTTEEGASAQFRYNWWMHTSNDGSYYAQGQLGQYIYINPAKELIVVRLGKDYGDIYWPAMFHDYAETVQ